MKPVSYKMTDLLEPNREYLYILMTRLIDCRKTYVKAAYTLSRGFKIPPITVNHELVHRSVCSVVQDEVGMKGTISTVLSPMYYT